MATMSDSARKKIQARQRKVTNAKNRAAKITKKERNAAPAKKAAVKKPAAKKPAAKKK